MKAAVLALAAVGIKTVVGQIKVEDYFPECAVDCVNKGIALTTCDPNDSICLCLRSNQYVVYNSAEQCAIDACGYDFAQRKCCAEEL